MTKPHAAAGTAVPSSPLPFTDDRLKRKLLAESMTSLLQAFKQKRDAVISLDAPWGAGKTWFCDEWLRYLQVARKDDFEVIKIDAFKHDYTEDAFGLIFSHLMQFTPLRKKQESFLKAASKIMQAAPQITKAAFNVTAKAVGAGEVVSAITEGLGETTEKLLEKSLTRFAEKTSPVDEFRAQLQTAAEKSPEQLVLFIDELDRCKPAFAVQMLDCIKHFFGVPNVVFVLFVNMGQLAKAVEHVHGCENGRDYLEKFIEIPLTLPKRGLGDRVSVDIYESFLNEDFEQLNRELYRDFKRFCGFFAGFAAVAQMELRLAKRAPFLWRMSQKAQKKPENPAILAWVVYLKLRHASIFDGLKSPLDGTRGHAHSEARSELKRIIDDSLWTQSHQFSLKNSTPLNHALTAHDAVAVSGNYNNGNFKGALYDDSHWINISDNWSEEFTDYLNSIDVPLGA